MTQHPKKPFNFRANPSDEPLRDKDNADPRHEPKIERKPAPNLAPSGTMGIRLGLQSKNSGRSEKRFQLGGKNKLGPEFNREARKFEKPRSQTRNTGRGR